MGDEILSMGHYKRQSSGDASDERSGHLLSKQARIVDHLRAESVGEGQAKQSLSSHPQIGCTPRGSCNNAILRSVLRRVLRRVVRRRL